jgi:hypothetical protein
VENLKRIVSNQYFPAAAVLTAVVLFWTIAMFGGLSLLHNNQPPMATLTWMLFVYAAAVVTPLAGIIAAVDLVRRWRRNRLYAQAEAAEYGSAEYEAAEYESAQYEPAGPEAAEFEVVQVTTHPDEAHDEAAGTEPATDKQPAPAAPRQAAQQRSATPQAAPQRPATPQATSQRTQPKQRKKAA